MKIIYSLTIVFLAGFAALGFSQEPGSQTVSIGKVGEYQVTIEGGELKPRDSDIGKPTAGRALWLVSCDRIPQEGTNQSWMIRYSAWKAGDYDLRDLFAWSDSFNKERIKPMLVTVVDPLPQDHQGQLEPAPVGRMSSPRAPTAFERWAIFAIWLSVLVYLLWLVWFKAYDQPGGVALNQDPLRRRLLEGLQTGARSALTPQTRAELQRQFLGLLFRDFSAPSKSMAEMLEWAQNHPEAGPLLTHFDEWLASTAASPTNIPSDLANFLEGSATKPNKV